jgi:hypothetical protein
MVASSMSTSNVTDMLVETGTFSSFRAGEVETMLGAWAKAGTAAPNHPVWGAPSKTKSRVNRIFLYILHLRKRELRV